MAYVIHALRSGGYQGTDSLGSEGFLGHGLGKADVVGHPKLLSLTIRRQPDGKYWMFRDGPRHPRKPSSTPARSHRRETLDVQGWTVAWL